MLLYALVGHGDKSQVANGTTSPIYYTTANTRTLVGFTPYFSNRQNRGTMKSGPRPIGLTNNSFPISTFIGMICTISKPRRAYPYVNAAGGQSFFTYMGAAPHVRLSGVEAIERFDPHFIPGLDLHFTGAFVKAYYVSYPQAPALTQDTFNGLHDCFSQ